MWCQQLLTVHGHRLKVMSSRQLVTLRTLQKSISRHQEDIGKVYVTPAHDFSHDVCVYLLANNVLQLIFFFFFLSYISIIFIPFMMTISIPPS